MDRLLFVNGAREIRVTDLGKFDQKESGSVV